jgi:hypothetical protein
MDDMIIRYERGISMGQTFRALHQLFHFPSWTLLYLMAQGCSCSDQGSALAPGSAAFKSRVNRVVEACLRASDMSHQEAADSISQALDKFFLEELNTSASHADDELIRVVQALLPSVPPFPRILAISRLASSPNYVLAYSVVLGAATGSTRLRIAEGGKGAFHLLEPAAEPVRTAQQELACWRGSDLFEKYGGTFRPFPVSLDHCVAIQPIRHMKASENTTTFTWSYIMASTCTSCFEILWEYDGHALAPLKYRWDSQIGDSWRTFNEKSPDDLFAELLARTPPPEK